MGAGRALRSPGRGWAGFPLALPGTVGRLAGAVSCAGDFGEGPAPAQSLPPPPPRSDLRHQKRPPRTEAGAPGTARPRCRTPRSGPVPVPVPGAASRPTRRGRGSRAEPESTPARGRRASGDGHSAGDPRPGRPGTSRCRRALRTRAARTPSRSPAPPGSHVSRAGAKVPARPRKGRAGTRGGDPGRGRQRPAPRPRPLPEAGDAGPTGGQVAVSRAPRALADSAELCSLPERRLRPTPPARDRATRARHLCPAASRAPGRAGGPPCGSGTARGPAADSGAASVAAACGSPVSRGSRSRGRGDVSGSSDPNPKRKAQVQGTEKERGRGSWARGSVPSACQACPHVGGPGLRAPHLGKRKQQ